MKQRRRRSRKRTKKTISPKYLLLIMAIICLCLIGFSRNYTGAGSALSNTIGYLIVPMQKGINKLGGTLSGMSVGFRSKQELAAENEELRAELSDLKTQLNQVETNTHELSELKELMELAGTYSDYDTAAASIVAKDSGNWFSTFLINRGTNAGIKIGMNVIADGALVGIVTDAGPNYAKVQSIIDDSSNVSAMNLNTSDLCMVNGSLIEMNENTQIEFSNMRNSEDNKSQIGDQLVTSAISDKYIKGIPIGYITEMDVDSDRLTRSGKLVPIVDFEHLEYVLVILETKDYADPELQGGRE